ncbi:MAG: hypothetical protein P8Y36_03325 [Alphaproteobacteria bacterium]
MSKSTFSNVVRHATVFGPLGAVGGFVSDVLQPLAPFSKYVFFLSLLAVIALVLANIIWRTFRRQLMPPLIAAVAFLVFSGGLMLLQTDDTQENGVLASYIPAIESLQSSLGVIQKDIAEIKQSTRETAENTARIAETTQTIARSNEKIVDTLEAMQKGFANLSKSGGVIENAKRPEEHYHNARIYEMRGDYLNARRAYNAYFGFKLNFLDPHLRYQTFLKVQEGRAGTREIYASLYEADKRPLMEFARIITFDAPQRTEMLKSFASAHADFAPAFYELSREYSAARKGVQSLGDKREELKALEAFLKLNSEGKFLKYFVDKELAAKWIEDANTRAKALAMLKQSSDAAPVSFTAMRSNAGWTITFQIREVPREVFYRLGTEGEFQSLGLGEYTNPATGLKMPNMFFSLKANTPRSTIQVKYIDIGNETRGPYDLEFDPNAELVKVQKKTLGLTKNNWISFRDYDGKTLVYFTHLLTARCALRKIAYGVNSDATPKIFDMPACNPKDPYSVRDSKIYIEVPGDSRFVTVRLTYADGSKSEPERFER